MKKKKGNASIGALFIMLLFILSLFTGFVIEVYFIHAKAEIAQDDIVFSNLAAYKKIDKTILGNDPSVFWLSDPYDTLEVFKYYLSKNMKLDEGLNGKQGSIAKGNVKIKEYIIYNIEHNRAEIHRYNPDKKEFTLESIDDIQKSPIYSPTNVLITKTSIYTVIEFDIEVMMKGIDGDEKTQMVEALTDITK